MFIFEVCHSTDFYTVGCGCCYVADQGSLVFYVAGKRVLLVDFHSLHTVSGGSSRDDHSSDLRGLFRDADMNDAIIFFDECEAIFAQV
jgi:hypothetical protein